MFRFPFFYPIDLIYKYNKNKRKTMGNIKNFKNYKVNEDETQDSDLTPLPDHDYFGNSDKERALEILNGYVHKAFYDNQTEHGVNVGDIDPVDQVRLDELQEEIAKIMVKQVMGNES